MANDITRNFNGVMSIQLLTDNHGVAQAWWAMGGDAGYGNNRVCVTSAGLSNNVYFCASANPAPAHQINIGSGNNQKGETGAPAAEPLRAWVNDGCNGIAGLPVTFRVVQGGGKLLVPGQTGSGTSELTVPTIITGHAAVNFVFGPDAGNNVVEATFAENPGLPATFTLYGVARDPAKPTSLSGLVLDNSSQPIGHAWCEIFIAPDFSNPVITTFTDTQGRFAFPDLGGAGSTSPISISGPIDLFIYGPSATSVGTNAVPPNSFPFLSYSMVLIPNAENSLPKPVLLPRLNVNNQRLYYGTNDLVLTCEGMEGLKMTIKANSMKDARGIPVTPANPAVVSLNQVHHDQVPMPIPDGASPPFAWTLQPARSTFDPPIEIEYPNMSGLAAGTIAYFLSFNHDTGRFEIVASGHVTGDGSTIMSDAGAGLTIGGWGCNCPPYAVSGKVRNKCKLAVVCFQGGPRYLNWVVGFALESLCNSLKTLSPNRVFVKYIGSRDTAAEQLSPARDWLKSFDDQEGGRAKILLIGHSLGGDTIRESGSIEADARIAIDPIRRDLALGTHLYYQRPFDYPAPNSLSANFLAMDLSLEKKKACSGNVGLTDTDCLRGYRMSGLGKVMEGTDHGSVVAAAGPTISSIATALLKSEESPQFAATSPLRAAAGELDTIVLDSSFSMAGGGQSQQLEDDGSFLLQNISAPDQFGAEGTGSRPDFVSDDYVRVIGQSAAGGVTRYAFSEFFQIRQGQTVTVTNLTFTDVPPRKPESLTIIPEARVMTDLTKTNRLRVIATYADGGTNDVAPRASWTSYRVSNPNIVTLTSDGGVIPKARGTVYVTAVNEGATAVIQLGVSPDDKFTTVTGQVLDTNGVAVAGVAVSVNVLAGMATTDAQGRYTIAGVPTGLGTILVTAFLSTTNIPLLAVSEAITPVSGGQTEVPVLVLKPGFPGMAYIPAGTFIMGSPLSEAERYDNETQHQVTLTRGFWMGKYEVTQGEYADVMGSNPNYFRNGVPGCCGGNGAAVTNEFRHPVETVSWFDATNYCGKLTARELGAGRIPAGWGYRLPTESEWEYACRGGTTNAFHYGVALRQGMANFWTLYEYDSTVGTITTSKTYLGRTSDVGSYAANAYGLYDMHGNVWEWCQDWYGTYPGNVTDPVGANTGSGRVDRGGSWRYGGRFCRSADRNGSNPDGRGYNIGFRVVLSPGQ